MNKNIVISSWEVIDAEQYDTSAVFTASNRFPVHGNCDPNQAFNGIITSDSDMDTLIQIARQSQFAPEQLLSIKFDKKWRLPRGGRFSYERLVSGFIRYCDTDSITLNPEAMDRVLNWGRAYFRRTNTTFFFRPRPLDATYFEYMKLYKCDHKSNGGITANTDRRKPAVQRAGIIQAKQNPFQLDPIIGGMRLLDKYRNIFMDSAANYYREAIFFAEGFSWIEAQPWNHHYSTQDLATILQTTNVKFSYGGDYKGMDYHFTCPVAHKVADLLCDIGHADDQRRSGMHCIIDQLFHAKVIIGCKAFITETSLLSGIYPTHDLESLLNFCINGYLCEAELNIQVVPFGTRLTRNTASILVCGDDVIICFGRTFPREEWNNIALKHSKVASYFGQILEVSKSDFAEDSIFFCKRFWPLNQSVPGRRYPDSNIIAPIYSLDRALWSLRHPEEVKRFPTRKGLMIWMASILDNAYGCKMWKGVVRAILDKNYEFFTAAAVEDLTDEDIATLNREWNFRAISAFNISSSPTICEIVSYFKEKHIDFKLTA